MRPVARLAFVYFWSIAGPALAGFQSTETYLVAVGRASGQLGAQIYSTIWATNLTGALNSFTVYFLKQGQANSSPASFSDTLAPGETKIYENVVESKFHLSGVIGAARIVSSGEILVSERIYNQPSSADLGNTEGFFFAGVPKTFSISSGQSASIQGVNQGGSENFRSNFILVETGGASTTVNIQIFDAAGHQLGQKAYPLQPYEQLQGNVGDIVPSIATTNGRITATVTGGTGSALLAGAQVANESQDASGFEMSFRDDILGSGGGTAGVASLNGLTGALTIAHGANTTVNVSGSTITIDAVAGSGTGLTAVAHDGSLAGSGTVALPLAIANGQVVRSLTANGTTLHDAVTLAQGSNITLTPSGSTITIAAAGGGGGGLTLPFSGSSNSTTTTFAISNSDGGRAIEGDSNASNISPANNPFAIKGVSTGTNGTGVYGTTRGASGETGWTGVWGDSHDATAVTGTSFNDRGVLGITNSASAAAAVEGLNRASDGVGVLGRTGSGSGMTFPLGAAGVWGDGGLSYGVVGTSSASPAVYGESRTGEGVSGFSTSNIGVYGTSDSKDGVRAQSDSGYGLYATSFTNLAIWCAGSGQYNGSWTNASDARFKENVAPLEDALERTLMLSGVSFDWRTNEFPERHFRTQRDIGFIAQEVEVVYPELVTTGRDGYKGVDYAKLTPILVEAIKAQQLKIDDLTQRLERLEAARP